MYTTFTTKLVAIVGDDAVVIRETSYGRWVVRVLDLEGRTVNADLTPREYASARDSAKALACEMIGRAPRHAVTKFAAPGTL